MVGRGVRAAGHAQDIAVIAAAPAEAAQLAALGTEIRALGFRYVTIDLAHDRDPTR
jgi:hypothetical protein